MGPSSKIKIHSNLLQNFDTKDTFLTSKMHRIEQKKMEQLLPFCEDVPEKKEVTAGPQILKIKTLQLNSTNLQNQKIIRNGVFEKLRSVLNYFFLHSPLNESHIAFSENEQKIFVAILKKKNIFFCKKSQFDFEHLSELSRQFQKKKRERYLKYVIPKCVKHLKKKHLNQSSRDVAKQYQIKTMTKKQREYEFYKHYFADLAKEENLPIESFFIFKNFTHRYSDHIPKTLNLDLMSLWKKNSRLIMDIFEYLDGDFYTDLKAVNQMKIDTLIDRWEGIVKKKGPDNGIKTIIGHLRGRHSKLPWTICEARFAVDKTLELLS